jgi:diketogulonate reductase-like aldo/keto reductase
MTDRRRFLQVLSLTALTPRTVMAATSPVPLQREIPSSAERIPAIGMGTWLTFDVGGDAAALATRVKVLQTFFDRGGRLVDSSPMYGSSEAVIGHCLRRVSNAQRLFAATKVWTWGQRSGINQMALSGRLWGVGRFDLMQIHNMLDWDGHLETLKAWKAEGRIRHIGITTSHGRRHDALEDALQREQFDFVQFTYNVLDREAEARLLPLAAERGTAVIANRPFQGGDLFDHVRGKVLPAWARDFDCANWAQFFLKFVISHPAVTCAIPATSRVDHMEENMGALYGRLPDPAQRRRMAELVRGM